MHNGLLKDKLPKIMFAEKTNREKACPFRGLSHGPTMEVFYAPKQTVKALGGVEWVGLELTESWRTGSSQKQSKYYRWVNI